MGAHGAWVDGWMHCCLHACVVVCFGSLLNAASPAEIEKEEMIFTTVANKLCRLFLRPSTCTSAPVGLLPPQ